MFFLFIFLLKNNCFTEFCCFSVKLRWVFVAVHGLSLIAASRGYSLVAMHGLLIEWLPLLQGAGSRASCCSMWAQELWQRDLGAQGHVRSSQTRDQTLVPCTSRQILYHWTTRELPSTVFLWEWKWKSESEVAQLCPTLCDHMDCSLPGFSVHGIFLARVLQWVAFSFSRGSFWLRDWIWVSRIAGRHFTIPATREE